MKHLVIVRNPFEPETWEHTEVADVRAAIMQNFEEWPPTARIYNENVSSDCDVTPYDEASIDKLETYQGPFFVVVYPQGVEAAIIIAVVALAASITFAILFRPKIPGRGDQVPNSPNNRLSGRINESRPNGRIPDIFGTVRSVPDLLMVPYKIYEDYDEVEYSYMCIGRGTYNISEVKEDTTLYSNLPDCSVDIYGPNTSPNYGSAQLTIGTHINKPLIQVKQCSAVDNLEVLAPNMQYKNSNSTLWLKEYKELRLVGDTTGTNFEEMFKPGDAIRIDQIIFGLHQYIDRIIESVTPTSMLMTTNWPSGAPGFSYQLLFDTIITTTGDRYEGPFTLDDTAMASVSANIVAPQGLYHVIDGNQYPLSIEFQLELTPIDVNGTPIGAAETFNNTLVGSGSTRGPRGLTIIATPTFTGRCSARLRRITPRYYADNVQQTVDTVNWTELYTTAPVDAGDFGDVTTAFIRTVASPLTIKVRNRKFNVIAQRRIHTRISGNTFSSTLTGTNRADEIFAHICLDQKIGRRAIDDLDVDSIYNAAQDVVTNFSNDITNTFNHTFDDANTSFEETLAVIASAIFCQAYRRGRQIKLSFEKATIDSTLLFNHRNKVPGSEIRSVRFGYVDDNDGIEFTYVDPADEAIVTMYLPSDQSALNPKRIEGIGIRHKLQAYFHAHRIWNKMRYQNVSVEFEATQEAEIIVLQDRILVADNTRPDTQDGEVVSQNVLELTLSQDVSIIGASTIFLQHVDGTVESMAVTAGSSARKVILAQAPRLALALTDEYYAKTTYVIIKNSSTREQAFLAIEKDPKTNFTHGIKAINYDDRYYANDTDYALGIVDGNGNVGS